MPHCLGIRETTGVNRTSWHAAGKNKAGLFFFSPDPIEKPDQRYGAVGMQLWPYNTDSFCYQPFLVCLLCVILSDRGVWQQGRYNSFDSYKPGATKHRCAKTLSLHYFSITVYIWFEAPIHTVAKIRASSSSLSPGLPLSSKRLKSARESGEQGGGEEPSPHWTLWRSPHLLCDDLGHPPHPWSKTSPVPLSHSYCPHLSSTSLLLHHSRHSLGLGTNT